MHLTSRYKHLKSRYNVMAPDAKGKTRFLLVEKVALYDTMGLQKNLWGSRVIVDLRFIKL